MPYRLRSDGLKRPCATNERERALLLAGVLLLVNIIGLWFI